MVRKRNKSGVICITSFLVFSFSSIAMADQLLTQPDRGIRTEAANLPQKAFTSERGLDQPLQTSQPVPLSQQNLQKVSGTIQKGSVSIKTGFLYIQSETEYKDYHANIENGQFTIDLPNGTYRIDSYYDEAAMTGSKVDYTFTVQNGKTDPALLKIEIPPDNVTGIIEKGNVRVENGEIYVHGKTGTDMHGYNGRITNGQFSLYLPDGTYTVDSYYDEVAQISGSIDYTFTVKNGKTTPSSLNIEIPPDNVAGTIQKGTAKVLKGGISLFNQNGEDQRGYHTRINNGQFSLYLPDGTYIVDTYYDETAETSSSLEYTFTVKDGKTEPSPLNIEIPPDNVTGTIHKGDVPVTRGELSFFRQDGENQRGYYARIKNGQFSLYLPDGLYKVDTYYDETAQASSIVDYTFTVKNGKMEPSSLNIEVPPDNVTGTLQKGSTKITEGELSLFKKDEKDQRWYSARIKNGQFSLYLLDGTYKVDMYYDETAQTNSTMDYEFTVENGKIDPLTIMIPPDNVTGTIQKGAVPVTKGEISLFSQDGEDQRGYYARIENGQFSLYLPDGTYIIHSYYNEETRKNGNAAYTFIVKDGKTITPSLDIEIPSDNVVGTLQKGSEKVVKGEIFLHSKSGNTPFGYHAQIENSQFSLYLPDGTYTAAWYYDEQSGKEGNAAYTFTVKDGKTVPASLDIVVPRDNVKGTIKADSIKNLNGFIRLQNKNETEGLEYHTRIENGAFSLYLPAGRYTITAFMDEQTGREVPVNYTFTVKKGKLKRLSLNVEIPQDNVTEPDHQKMETLQP